MLTQASVHWPPPDVAGVSFGYMLSHAVHICAELGVADLLQNGPKTADELAAELGVHGPSLLRLLRTLSAFGFFAFDGTRFSLNDATAPLCRDAPNSVLDLVLSTHSEWQQVAWRNALYSIRTGRSSLEHATGHSLFGYLLKHPSEHAQFNRAMQAATRGVVPALLETFEFAPGSYIVDLGGGDGTLLTMLLDASPDCTGTVVDLKPVIDGIPDRSLPDSVASRVAFSAGDFFEHVPPGADYYILKHVLHDWDDEKSCVILGNCRQALSATARLLIIESVMREGEGNRYAHLIDLGLLVATAGRERSQTEYESLCSRSGLQVRRVLHNRSPFAILEVVVAHAPSGGEQALRS